MQIVACFSVHNLPLPVQGIDLLVSFWLVTSFVYSLTSGLLLQRASISQVGWFRDLSPGKGNFFRSLGVQKEMVTKIDKYQAWKGIFISTC